LSELCDGHIQLQDSFVMSDGVAELTIGRVTAIIPDAG
jgi:hypothetical protein